MKIETSRCTISEQYPSPENPKQSYSVVVAWNINVQVDGKDLCGAKVFTGAPEIWNASRRGEVIISGYQISNADTPRSLATYVAAYSALQAEITAALEVNS